MSSPETNPKPWWRKRPILAFGVLPAVAVATLVAAAFVFEQIEDLMWHQ
jgi:hypothetical protein